MSITIEDGIEVQVETATTEAYKLLVSRIVAGELPAVEAVEEMGRAGGAGASSLADAARLSTLAVFLGQATESDAEVHYDRYRYGHDAAINQANAEPIDNSAGARKNRLSEYRTFMKHGVAKHMAVQAQAIALRETLSIPERNSIFVTLRQVNRAQNNQPGVMLTDEEILKAIAKKTSEPKTDLEKLIALRDATVKLHKNMGGLLRIAAEFDVAIKLLEEAAAAAAAAEEGFPDNVTTLIPRAA